MQNVFLEHAKVNESRHFAEALSSGLSKSIKKLGADKAHYNPPTTKTWNKPVLEMGMPNLAWNLNKVQRIVEIWGQKNTLIQSLGIITYLVHSSVAVVYIQAKAVHLEAWVCPEAESC